MVPRQPCRFGSNTSRSGSPSDDTVSAVATSAAEITVHDERVNYFALKKSPVGC
jgi:hypothetical protein